MQTVQMHRLKSAARRKPSSGTLKISNPSITSELVSVFTTQRYRKPFSALLFTGCLSCRVFFTKLNECETDDDIAMCFLKNKEGFEKYLQYLVGQGPAESAVGDRTVHRFFKVTPEQ